MVIFYPAIVVVVLEANICAIKMQRNLIQIKDLNAKYA